MRKALTAKDVLYALEYLNERLVLGTDGKWTLQPSRQPVQPRVADEAKSGGVVVGTSPPGVLAVYSWGKAA